MLGLRRLANLFFLLVVLLGALRGAASGVTFTICLWTNVQQNVPTSTTCKKAPSKRGQTSEIDDLQNTCSVFFRSR